MGVPTQTLGTRESSRIAGSQAPPAPPRQLWPGALQSCSEAPACLLEALVISSAMITPAGWPPASRGKMRGHCLLFNIKIVRAYPFSVNIIVGPTLHAKLLQSFPTLCDTKNCSPPGSSVPGSLQARILEWVALPSSRGSSQRKERTHVSWVSCIAGGFFTAEPLRPAPLEKSSLSLVQPLPSGKPGHLFWVCPALPHGREVDTCSGNSVPLVAPGETRGGGGVLHRWGTWSLLISLKRVFPPAADKALENPSLHTIITPRKINNN